MIEFRPFRNDDPPRLADVWRMARLGPMAMQPMTAALLEATVFSKPQFDRFGLTVATEDRRVVGFAHAGFGPSADRESLDRRIGSTLLLVVPPQPCQDEIASGLLVRSESYLKAAGAEIILGGATPTMGGFYLGVYGGADLPGVLDSSAEMRQAFERAGYLPHERIAVLRRSLAGFRPSVNRLQLAIRRATRLEGIDDPKRRTWWEAVVTSGIGLRRYDLRSGTGRELLGSALVWDMQPQAAAWGAAAAGLLDIDIAGPRRREGLAHYLLAEVMHDLASEGVVMIEAHASAADEPIGRLLAKIGFEATCHGTIYRKPSCERVMAHESTAPDA